MSRLGYLKRSVLNQFSPERFRCLNCGGANSLIIQRKLVVTQLRRCADCQMMFRTPTDPPLDNADYYENEYSQGFASQVPGDDELAQLKATRFRGTERNYDYYIDVMKQLGVVPGARVFDYGCSWGYGSYQFAVEGYDVTSFEIARTRREFGRRKLGVNAVDDMERVVADPNCAGAFDCFFSAHVIEHVPSPKVVFDYSARLLRPGGIFIAFVPNGSEPFRARHTDARKLWGEVHPNFIDDVFLDKSFAKSPRIFGSLPEKLAVLPAELSNQRLDGLTGYELFFASKKVSESWA